MRLPVSLPAPGLAGRARNGSPRESPVGEPVREFPLPLPTARCAWVLAACGVPVAAGALWTPLAWTGLAAIGALAVATVADWFLLPRARAFRVARRGRESLGQAEDEDLVAEVRLAGPGAVRVRAVLDLPPGFERLGDPRPARLGDAVPVVLVTRARATERGDFAVGPLHLRWRGRAGLAERQARFELDGAVRVLPGIRAVAKAARRLRRGRHEEAGARRSRRRGEGTSFESLREYARGEDPRHIDWKASARHGKLIARHFELERNQNVMLLVDCGRWMTAEVAGRTRLDHALDACALLAHAAAALDDRVGFMAFADEVLAYAPPAKGRAAVQALLESSLRVQPRLVESDYARAFAELAARHRKRSLLVLFTDVLSRDASHTVVRECARSVRHHLPLVVTLRDPELDAMASRTPANAAAAYRQAAAEELLLEREHALAVMRRAGVQVAEAKAGALGADLVERYLDAKARMLV